MKSVNQSKAIANWLASLPRVGDVTPCTVSIKGKLYPAARYTQEFETLMGSIAYASGERKYNQTMIYVVGMLPAVYRNNTNVVFTLGNEHDWFVASYFGNLENHKQESAKPTDYHPFGNMFLLTLWEAAEKIDAHSPTPYKRVPAQVSFC